ncbi:energy transducer TonB [Tamlana agarivorans]|uniref:Energy transducer TonB n=1 Tax=Pseudotamlana agarivorans TaxID=481183 RepID=A0ACC5U8E4_9FLAO|nr:energy transducer TonB [Tamlana agarivorans]MBU2950513.1 energy transducer TonB [Tamlana agarivorans]
MSDQKKTHELIRQNEKFVKKSQKHDANLRKNTMIYFQVGLIMCLLVVFALLEMNFETTIPSYKDDLPPIKEVVWVDVPLIKTVVPEVPREPVKERSKKEPLTFEVIEDDEPDVPFKDEVVKKEEPVVLNPGALIPLVEKPTDEAPVPFAIIEDAPIYPGCENSKGNLARKKCMSEKISMLMRRKFDGSAIATDYGLTGRQRINVQFTIDKTGHVTNVKTRAPHPKLKKEAERVIKIIPKMKPGRQRDKNVGVIYTLPIVFQVQ